MSQRFLQIVDHIYGAAQDPNLWPQALEAMAESMHSSAANLIVNLSGCYHDGISVSHGIDPAQIDHYNKYYVSRDPINVEAFRQPVGTLISSMDYWPTSYWRNTELYVDMCKPYSVDHIFGATLVRTDRAFSAFSMMRPPGGKPLSDEDCRTFQFMVGHLQRAIALHIRLTQAEQRNTTLCEIMDMLTVGLVLVDEHSQVRHANAAAQRMARQGDGFGIGRNGIQAAVPAETNILRRLVQEAVASHDGEALSGSGVGLCSRPSRRRPYQVLVTPLSRRERESAAAAAVFITDPEEHPAPIEHQLSRLFNLTTSEARLSTSLLGGDSLEDAADQFGVSKNTVRTQLRSIFEKTDTRRQSELISLLLRSPLGAVSED